MASIVKLTRHHKQGSLPPAGPLELQPYLTFHRRHAHHLSHPSPSRHFPSTVLTNLALSREQGFAYRWMSKAEPPPMLLSEAVLSAVEGLR